MSDPMPTILDTFAEQNAIRKLDADTHRDDLQELFERHGDVDENGVVWIRADTAADLVVDL